MANVITHDSASISMHEQLPSTSDFDIFGQDILPFHVPDSPFHTFFDFGPSTFFLIIHSFPKGFPDPRD